jgi:hypothetical protein
MSAITGIVFVKRIPIGGAAAGALVKEIWKVPASTDGDTQTLALPFISNVLSVTGPVTAVVPNLVAHALDVTTIATIDASTMSYIEIIGTE